MSNKSLKSLTIDFVRLLILFSLVFLGLSISFSFLTSFTQELRGEVGGFGLSQEICDNGVDDDGDGTVDADDEDCDLQHHKINQTWLVNQYLVSVKEVMNQM